MIEAVNAVIANSPVIRAVTQNTAPEGVVAAQALAEEKVEPVLAPYVSPYIQVDNNFDTAVIQIRDSDTGDVLTQFPSEPALKSREAIETFIDGGSVAVNQEPITPAVSVSSSDSGVNAVQTVTIAQSAPAAQSLGAGGAQAAITALSTGAQSGQATPTANIQVSA